MHTTNRTTRALERTRLLERRADDTTTLNPAHNAKHEAIFHLLLDAKLTVVEANSVADRLMAMTPAEVENLFSRVETLRGS